MRISINHPEYYKYEVIDKDNGYRIPNVQEADDETGYIVLFIPQFNYTEQNYTVRYFRNGYGETELITHTFKANIKIIKKEK